jgi:hypothetical protein
VAPALCANFASFVFNSIKVRSWLDIHFLISIPKIETRLSMLNSLPSQESVSLITLLRAAEISIANFLASAPAASAALWQ